MSSTRTRAARGSRSLPGRITRATRKLSPEQRLAGLAACCLFLTLFLPWYQESVIITSAKGRPVPATESLTGWAAFSWVEAAVLLVAVSVLVLLFQRAEGRAFHLPGGDGWAITLAGGWTCFLVAWRMLDKQGTTGHGQYASTSGIEWGIFVALGVAGLLTYAGTRIRASRRPEPPLPSADGAVFDGHWHTPAPRASEGSGEPTVARRTSATERATARRAAATATDEAAEGRSPTAATEPAAVPRPTPAIPAGADADDAATPQRTRAPRRSSWRPADHPEWSEPERPVGWLTGAPGDVSPPDPHDSEDAQTLRRPADRAEHTDLTRADDSEQLTMPLEGDE